MAQVQDLVGPSAIDSAFRYLLLSWVSLPYLGSEREIGFEPESEPSERTLMKSYRTTDFLTFRRFSSLGVKRARDWSANSRSELG